MLKIGLKSRDMFIHAIYKQYAVSSNSAVVAETVNVYVHIPSLSIKIGQFKLKF